MSETFFCRLCLVSTENYQLLDGELIDIVDDLLLQNKSMKSTVHIVCVNCVTKIHKAFEFKSTCMNTKVTLSHYVGPQENAKLDLKMIYLVEKEPGKEIYSYEEMKICRTCLNMIESGLYACLLDSIKFNGLEDIFKLYIPDLMLTLTESPLICEKCINNFRCFSEVISTFLNTENRIKGVVEQTRQDGSNKLELGEILVPSEGIENDACSTFEEDNMKLFEFKHLPLDSYSNSNKILTDEENEERIMKMIIKEDTDLFYREQPDYDSENDTLSVNDRLCLISTDEYKPLEGVLNEMVNVLLQNTSLKATESPIICDSCITKIHKAFEFKLTCVNTEVKLSHYVSSQENAKLDLRMVYLVEKKPGKEVHFHENMKICRICLDMIESGHCASLLDTVEINKLEDMFKIYIPELTLMMTESPLLCEKCIEPFKCFAEFISMSLETENKIKSFCDQIDHGENNQLDLEKIMAPPKEEIEEEHKNNVDTEESKIMKLFRDEHILLDFYNNSETELEVEENERKIMKMIYEEDIDLFYKDRPNFDSIDDEFEDSGNDSYQENAFFSSKNPLPALTHWDMVETFDHSDYQVFGIDEIQSSIGDDSPQPSSPEETPSSPEIISPKKWFDCKANSPNTPKGSCPDCEGSRHKKKWCDKCKWKKALSYNYTDSSAESLKPVGAKKSKKDGRKCRKPTKVYEEVLVANDDNMPIFDKGDKKVQFKQSAPAQFFKNQPLPHEGIICYMSAFSDRGL
ncbi:unnamed protein product [Phaedon cochleariae]|uniref:ZAD domain-containing protein n=1 Tax=Phaedon cochleariae TaxID=80249 RepID=A0A9N9SMF2_PHACE|nr:unnamed protein product [Phaedon cochleariae]